jgi:hypothetical protein
MLSPNKALFLNFHFFLFLFSLMKKEKNQERKPTSIFSRTCLPGKRSEKMAVRTFRSRQPHYYQRMQ